MGERWRAVFQTGGRLAVQWTAAGVFGLAVHGERRQYVAQCPRQQPARKPGEVKRADPGWDGPESVLLRSTGLRPRYHRDVRDRCLRPFEGTGNLQLRWRPVP